MRAHMGELSIPDSSTALCGFVKPGAVQDAAEVFKPTVEPSHGRLSSAPCTNKPPSPWSPPCSPFPSHGAAYRRSRQAHWFHSSSVSYKSGTSQLTVFAASPPRCIASSATNKESECTAYILRPPYILHPLPYTHQESACGVQEHGYARAWS